MQKRYHIWALTLTFAFGYCLFALIKHLRFETNAFDLGYYDQVVWLASKGRPLISSLIQSHTWTDHVSPTIFLLTPFYWIFPSPLVLLFAQAILVSFGAYPIYALAFKKLKAHWVALSLAFAYIAFYGIQNAVAYEFHPFTLAAPALAWIFYLYETKRNKLFWFAMFLFVGLQENFFLLAAVFGIFLMIRYKDLRRGFIISMASIVTFLILIFVVIPFFGRSYNYLPQHLSEVNISSLISLLYTPSSKILVVFASLLAFGFLPVASITIWPLLAEELLGRFLIGRNVNWWVMDYQYNATLAPILAFGAMDVIKTLIPQKMWPTAALVIVVGTVISLIIANPQTKRLFDPKFYDLSREVDKAKLVSFIPKDASVAATNNLGGHLGERKVLIFLTNCITNTSPCGNEERRCFDAYPDYIAADLTEGNGSNNYYPDYSKDAIVNYLDYLEKKGKYKIVAKFNDEYLYKKIYD
jgi:uncharacterized membrane protein